MDKKNFFYNTSIVIIIFSFNKILGFFRESLIAANYGATDASDAFYFAMSMTSLIFIISGAFTQIMKPMIIRIQTEKSIEAGEKFFNGLLNFIGLLMLIGCIVIGIFAKEIIALFGQGFTIEKIEFTAGIFRIALLSAYSISMSTIYASYFDCRKMFISSAFDAYFFNIITISFLLLFANSENIILFTYIYAFGEFFRLIYFNIVLKKKGYQHSLTVNGFKDPNVRKTGKLALPLLIGNLSGIVNKLIDRILASSLQVGSIASLHYADRVTSIFTTLILGAVMKVVFPSLTEVSLKNKEEYKRKVSQVFNFTLFLAIPVVTAFVVFASTIVTVIYEHGVFSSSNTKMVAEIVVIYSISMLFSSMNFTMGKFFYINKQTKIILISGLLGFILNVTFNLILVKIYFHIGLALATLIASMSRSLFMMYILYFKNKSLLFMSNLKCFLRTIIATIISISGAYLVSKWIYSYMFAGIVINEIIGLIVIGVTGVLIYCGILYAMKSEELNYFLPKKIRNIKE